MGFFERIFIIMPLWFIVFKLYDILEELKKK
jgi:hypothetical protein